MARYLTFGLVVCLWSVLMKCASSQMNVHCYINVTQEYHENQPLLLRHNSSEFLYPRIHTPSSFEMNAGKAEIRVACPADLLVADTDTLGVGVAFLKCHGGSSFGVAGSQMSTPFDRIGCTRSATTIMRMRRHNCPIGKCVQVGFLVNIFTFMPVIDIIAYDTENKVPLWAHTKIVAVIENRQRIKQSHEFRMGPLLQNTTVEISDIYNREYQRRRMRVIFDDPEEVEWYLSDMTSDDKYFVEGQLVSRHDFFYRAQQQSTFFYENVVPIWKSVDEGNWRYVSKIVRTLASETMSDLDVWSGSIGVLTMHAAAGDSQRKIYLARDVNGKSIMPAPRILFKYIHDKRANRGLVFLVVNNPHLDKVSSDYVICKRQPICESMYPQFSQLDRGYTYCCTLDGFLETAKSLGLPTFAGATSIGAY